MEKVKKIIDLTREQFNTLVEEGSVIINGEVKTHDENNIYRTPQPAYYEQVDGVVMPTEAGTLATQEWIGANSVKWWKHTVEINNPPDSYDCVITKFVFICDNPNAFEQKVFNERELLFINTRNILLCYYPQHSPGASGDCQQCSPALQTFWEDTAGIYLMGLYFREIPGGNEYYRELEYLFPEGYGAVYTDTVIEYKGEYVEV